MGALEGNPAQFRFVRFLGLVVGGLVVANCSGNIIGGFDLHDMTASSGQIQQNSDLKPNNVAARAVADSPYDVRVASKSDHYPPNHTGASHVTSASSTATLPKLDVAASCHGAVQIAQSTDVNAATQHCLGVERRTRTQLVEQWSTFSAAARSECANITKAYAPSYTELLTCLEMAHEYRDINLEAKLVQ